MTTHQSFSSLSARFTLTGCQRRDSCVQCLTFFCWLSEGCRSITVLQRSGVCPCYNASINIVGTVKKKNYIIACEPFETQNKPLPSLVCFLRCTSRSFRVRGDIKAFFNDVIGDLVILDYFDSLKQHMKNQLRRVSRWKQYIFPDILTGTEYIYNSNIVT